MRIKHKQGCWTGLVSSRWLLVMAGRQQAAVGQGWSAASGRWPGLVGNIWLLARAGRQQVAVGQGWSAAAGGWSGLVGSGGCWTRLVSSSAQLQGVGRQQAHPFNLQQNSTATHGQGISLLAS